MPETKTPFKGIVLALSGGGYRAAAFHLGMLKMLNRLDLLKQVRGISTISGGTIVGAAYVKSLVEDTPFKTFADDFRSFMNSTNVVKVALKKIKMTRRSNGKDVEASLIRSAANVYAKKYFGQMRFREILDKREELAKQNKDFPEISFNTTEFRVGNAFRFQSSLSNDVGSGNNSLDIPQTSETNKAVRVADIVAASSCFPSGFEPIRFPSDFVWEKTVDIAKVRAELTGINPDFKDEIPLMDGGVYDNQGVDSGRNIINRSKIKPLVDLFVISDTDPGPEVISGDEEEPAGLLNSPVAEAGRFRVTVSHLYHFILLVLVLAGITSLAIAVNLINEYRAPTQTWVEIVFLNVVPLIFAAAAFSSIVISKVLIGRELKKLKKKLEIPVWDYVRGLRVSEVVELVYSRISSLIVMSSSVFMKRIRGLQQGLVTRGGSTKDIALFGHIYGLRDNDNYRLIPSKQVYSDNKWERFLAYEELLVKEHLRKISDTATKYPTNLWFKSDDETNLDNLIECGAASMCYFLLVFILRRRSDQLDIIGSPERKLFEEVRATWNSLNK